MVPPGGVSALAGCSECLIRPSKTLVSIGTPEDPSRSKVAGAAKFPARSRPAPRAGRSEAHPWQGGGVYRTSSIFLWAVKAPVLI